MTSMDLICLGVGKGATYVIKGDPSSAFVIRLDGQPKLLVDCGAGVVLSCFKHLGIVPNSIYITHNHMDHTGDLPIALGITNGRPRILGHPSVLQIVKEHRLHESTLDVPPEKLADWIEPDGSGAIDIGDDFSIHPFQSVHSYTCYGFVLKRFGKDILGYSADSDFDEVVYNQITQAPIAIVSGRDNGNSEHASFEEIEQFAKNVPQCSIWVIHYEKTDYSFSVQNVKFLHEGEIVTLA